MWASSHITSSPSASDIRVSSALDIIALLEHAGANVAYHDPHTPKFQLLHSMQGAIDLTANPADGADGAGLANEQIARGSMHGREHAKFIENTRRATSNSR